MDFNYLKISDKYNFVVSDEITTSIFNELYGAALFADRWTRYSPNTTKDPYLNYYMKHNVIDLYNGETLTALGSDTDVSDDDGDNDTMFYQGATRCTANNSTSSIVIGGYMTGLGKDLTEYPDGSSVDTTNDFLIVSFYISDKTNFRSLGLRLGADSSNYYYLYPFVTAFSNGYNHYVYALSSHAVYGSPSWSNIDYLAFRASCEAGVSIENEYVTFQGAQIIRQFNSLPQPFQRPDGSGTLVQPYGTPTSYVMAKMDDKNGFVFTRGEQGTVTDAMQLTVKPVKEFYAELLSQPCFDSYSLGLSFRIDSDNYIVAYVDNDTFKLSIYENGSLVDSDSQALSGGVLRHETFRIALGVDDGNVLAQISANGETRLINAETSLQEEGHIVASQPLTESMGLVKDYLVSNERKEIQKYPQVVIQKTYQEITTKEATELNAYLEPNGVYLINTTMALRTTVAGDCVVDWATTGDVTQVTYRTIRGPAIGQTTPYDTTVKISVHNLSTDVRYAMSTSNVVVRENFIVKTGPLGGRIYPEIRQYASETVVVNGLGCWMEVNKVHT